MVSLYTSRWWISITSTAKIETVSSHNLTLPEAPWILGIILCGLQKILHPPPFIRLFVEYGRYHIIFVNDIAHMILHENGIILVIEERHRRYKIADLNSERYLFYCTSTMTFCGWRLLIAAVWPCVVWNVGLSEFREQYTLADCCSAQFDPIPKGNSER